MALVWLAAMCGERNNIAKLSAISIRQNLCVQFVIIAVRIKYKFDREHQLNEMFAKCF